MKKIAFFALLFPFLFNLCLSEKTSAEAENSYAAIEAMVRESTDLLSENASADEKWCREKAEMQSQRDVLLAHIKILEDKIAALEAALQDLHSRNADADKRILLLDEAEKKFEEQTDKCIQNLLSNAAARSILKEAHAMPQNLADCDPLEKFALFSDAVKILLRADTALERKPGFVSTGLFSRFSGTGEEGVVFLKKTSSGLEGSE